MYELNYALLFSLIQNAITNQLTDHVEYINLSINCIRDDRVSTLELPKGFDCIMGYYEFNYKMLSA